ncbi:MAG: hypothetical protein K2X69_06590, partial [Silvanigrellaceae bacterium]|nr:hypothetical protein [Silvanigrellaceae bacterium]
MKQNKDMTLSCVLGKTKIYEVSYNSKGMSHFSFLNYENTSFQLVLKGEVKESCTEIMNNNLIFLLDFNDLSISGLYQNLPLPIIKNQDNSKVFLKLSNKGYIKDIFFKEGIDPVLEGVYKDYIFNSFVDFSEYNSKINIWDSEYNLFGEIIYLKYVKNENLIRRNFIDKKNSSVKYTKELKEDVLKKYHHDIFTDFLIDENNIPININMFRNISRYLNEKEISMDETHF